MQSAHRHVSEIKPFHHQIFTKVSVRNVGSFLSECFYFLSGEETDLSVPVPSVGVSLYSPGFREPCTVHTMFLYAPHFADTYCLYSSHIILLSDSSDALRSYLLSPKSNAPPVYLRLPAAGHPAAAHRPRLPAATLLNPHCFRSSDMA